MIGEQHADLVTGQRPPATRAVRHRRRDAVGVRVVGQGQVGVHLGCQGQEAVHRTRLLGIGERHGGEVTVGLGLLGDDVDVRVAGILQGSCHQGQTDTVQGGVGQPHLGAGHGRPG